MAKISAPFDDLVQGSHNTLGRQREVDLDAKPFTIEVIQHVQEQELPTIGKPIGHEVHRPGHIWLFWNAQLFRLLPLQTLARLDAQVQLELPVDAIDPFVVPAMSPDIARYQEAKAEAPCPVRRRRPRRRPAMRSFSSSSFAL